MRKPSADQRGIGQLGLILGIVVVLIAGVVGWWVWQNNSKKDKASNVSQVTEEAIKNAKCNYDDEDLCKFYTGWKAQPSYNVTSTTTQANGTKTTSLIKTEGSNKFYMKLEGATSYEIIQIDDVMYTKTADGTWWKQTLAKSDLDKYKNQPSTDLQEPSDSTNTTATDKSTYKKIGKEKCGSNTCFKYQVIDPDDTKTTSYIWFDDNNYQLRRMQSSNNQYTWDSTYDYTNVSITAPAPTKDLQPGQYLVPGQNQPVTLPATGDY